METGTGVEEEAEEEDSSGSCVVRGIPWLGTALLLLFVLSFVVVFGGDEEEVDVGKGLLEIRRVDGG